MVASVRVNVLNKRVTTLVFMRPFPTSELWFHACFQLDVTGFPRPVHESSLDELQEELKNPSEDESVKLSFELLSYSLNLEMNASAII